MRSGSGVASGCRTVRALISRPGTLARIATAAATITIPRAAESDHGCFVPGHPWAATYQPKSSSTANTVGGMAMASVRRERAVMTPSG